MNKKYGQFEQVNGGTVNDLIAELEAIKEQSSARIAELEKKLAEQQLHFMSMHSLWVACGNKPKDLDDAELKAQILTARAEERAKVMKEVSETPVDYWHDPCGYWHKGDLIITDCCTAYIRRPTFKE